MKKILPLLLLALSLSSVAQQQQPAAPVTMTPELTKSVIDTLSKALIANYVFTDKARLMSKYLYGQLAKGAYRNIKDPRVFADTISDDLQTACPDQHIHFDFNPSVPQTRPGGQPAPDRYMDSLEKANLLANNFAFTASDVLSGNVGYVKFTGFMPVSPAAKETITAAFRFVQHTQALIIDLRENHGGNEAMIKQIESYFFPEKTRMNDVITPGKRDTAKGWTDPTATDGLVMRMPVFILTSTNTFSAGENFAYAMQAAKRAVIAGEKTAGASHFTDRFFLGHGFMAGIPNARAYNIHTGTEWEGVGVIPDIALKADTSLDAITSILFPDSWIAKQRRSVYKLVDPAAAQPWLGTYESGLKFYVKDSALYCDNAQRGNQTVKLLYISPGYYQLDEMIQIKFGQQQGATPGLQLYFGNGLVMFRKKIQ